MRFIEIDNITFIDKDGNRFPIKDIRPIEELTTAAEVEISNRDMIDEVATRTSPRIYGEDSEHLIYKVFDHNAREIIEAGWDLGKLSKLKIPFPENGIVT